jgi:hypothetical protein
MQQFDVALTNVSFDRVAAKAALAPAKKIRDLPTPAFDPIETPL